MGYRILTISYIYASILDDKGRIVAQTSSGGRGSGWHIYSPKGDKYFGNARYKRDVLIKFEEHMKKKLKKYYIIHEGQMIEVEATTKKQAFAEFLRLEYDVNYKDVNLAGK